MDFNRYLFIGANRNNIFEKYHEQKKYQHLHPKIVKKFVGLPCPKYYHEISPKEQRMVQLHCEAIGDLKKPNSYWLDSFRLEMIFELARVMLEFNFYFPYPKEFFLEISRYIFDFIPDPYAVEMFPAVERKLNCDMNNSIMVYFEFIFVENIDAFHRNLSRVWDVCMTDRKYCANWFGLMLHRRFAWDTVLQIAWEEDKHTIREIKKKIVRSEYKLLVIYSSLKIILENEHYDLSRYGDEDGEGIHDDYFIDAS